MFLEQSRSAITFNFQKKSSIYNLTLTGSFDHENRSDVMSCIMDAREECSACPTPGPQERSRARRCRFCVMRCIREGKLFSEQKNKNKKGVHISLQWD